MIHASWPRKATELQCHVNSEFGQTPHDLKPKQLRIPKTRTITIVYSLKKKKNNNNCITASSTTILGRKE